MIRVVRSMQRYRTEHDGVVSRHCFAAGPHHDPDNTSFGALVGVDEHLVAPGAGFAEHAHRGVEIASWVLDGSLRHCAGDADERVAPGRLLHQSAVAGLRHEETNGGDAPLRFVQTTWLSDPGGSLAVVTGAATTTGPAHLFVARGSFAAGGVDLAEGDSLRADGPLAVRGDGELLLWRPA